MLKKYNILLKYINNIYIKTIDSFVIIINKMMKLNEYKENKIELNSFIIIIKLYMILICIRCSFSCFESVFIKK